MRVFNPFSRIFWLVPLEWLRKPGIWLVFCTQWKDWNGWHLSRYDYTVSRFEDIDSISWVEIYRDKHVINMTLQLVLTHSRSNIVIFNNQSEKRHKSGVWSSHPIKLYIPSSKNPAQKQFHPTLESALNSSLFKVLLSSI